MGINEKIVTGRKWRRLIDKDSKLWQLISWWTKASDVEFDDGKTAEQKLGNIDGITSDFSVNDESIAASSNLTNRAYERFDEFTDGGKIKRIIIGEDGKPYIEYEDGADTVLKKLGNENVVLLGSISSSKTFDLSSYDGYENFELGKNILGCDSVDSYNPSTGILKINQSIRTISVKVTGNGYVIDDGIRRTGNGEMTGSAKITYPKKIYLVY